MSLVHGMKKAAKYGLQKICPSTHSQMKAGILRDTCSGLYLFVAIDVWARKKAFQNKHNTLKDSYEILKIFLRLTYFEALVVLGSISPFPNFMFE